MPPMAKSPNYLEYMAVFGHVSGYASQTGSFAFANGRAPSRTYSSPLGAVNNSQRVLVFSFGGLISASNTYTSRSYRDIFYGIFAVSNSGATGTWDGPSRTFPRLATAKTLGFRGRAVGRL